MRGVTRNAFDTAAPVRVPLYRTIADAIIRDIRRGRHLEGERLPASRDLARSLEVNRATVHQALQLLKREGWIETNKGGGNAGRAPLERLSRARPRARLGPHRVVAPHPHPLRASGGGAGLGAVRPFAPRAGRAGLPGGCVRGATRRRGARRLAPRVRLAVRLPPAARDARRATRQARHPGRPGRAPHRERGAAGARPDHARARRSGRPGRRRDAELRGRALALPGAPGPARRRAARRRRVPRSTRSSARFSKSRSSLYTIPDFQNPTGLLSSPARRAEIAERAAAAGVLLVEDAFDADLLVEGALPPPLAALAPAHVVHLGTISKALFPGVRVGWISGPKEFVHRLAALKRVGELTSPPVLQAALNLFLVRGDYDRHLAKMRSAPEARASRSRTGRS